MSVERLERALEVAAVVVDLDGEDALGLFERIERELEDARRAAGVRADAVAPARRIAASARAGKLAP